MLGAIIGDIVGSIYEFNNIKTVDFPLFSDKSYFTDDTVMTLAVAEALMEGGAAENYVAAMKKYGKCYPNSGYGASFGRWVFSENPKAYNSFGNGSAMRVSPVAWWFDTLEAVEEGAKVSAAVTHNHPEGIKGAQATAAAIFLARNGESKDGIRDYIETQYGYNLRRTLDEIRPTYTFDETCQKTVPEAIIAFLESTGFEDAIRKAVWLGGDSDTLAAITGSIAEAAYGVPEDMREKALTFLDERLKDVFYRWRDWWESRNIRVPIMSIDDETIYREGRDIRIATKESWENYPIDKPKEIALNLCFNSEQFSRVKRGFIPRAMEDKWFIYYEDGWLYFHRSWTGKGIYKAELIKTGDGCAIESFWAERNQEKYSNEDDDKDRESLIFLIGRGLLDLDVRNVFVDFDVQTPEESLQMWSEFGRMLFGNADT